MSRCDVGRFSAIRAWPFKAALPGSTPWRGWMDLYDVTRVLCTTLQEVSELSSRDVIAIRYHSGSKASRAERMLHHPYGDPDPGRRSVRLPRITCKVRKPRELMAFVHLCTVRTLRAEQEWAERRSVVFVVFAASTALPATKSYALQAALGRDWQQYSMLHGTPIKRIFP